MMMISVSVFVFFCLRIEFFLPVFYHNLFIRGAQIDRLAMREGGVEFFDVVASDVLFAAGDQVSLHHIREGIDEDIERLTILLWYMLFFMRFYRFLEGMYGIRRLTRIRKYQGFIPHELDDDIRDTQDGVDPRVGPYFHTLYLFEWDNYEIGREELPLEIDERLVCQDPDIRIPVKYLINQYEIDQKKIRIDMPLFERSLDLEEIEKVEKSRDKEGKKYPENDILDDHKKMSMKNMADFFVWGNIRGKKE